MKTEQLKALREEARAEAIEQTPLYLTPGKVEPWQEGYEEGYIARASRTLTLDDLKAALPPLVWKKDEAYTPIGEYNVYHSSWKSEKPYRLWLKSGFYKNEEGIELGDFDTLEEAQSAAQDHHLQRVAELFNLKTETS